MRGIEVRSVRLFFGCLIVGLMTSAAVASPILRVSLDFFPNPSHVPLYVAVEAGMFAERGIEVDVIVPANPSDPVKLVAAQAIDVALTPQINYLIARAEGLPLVAIGALIDRSLGGLLSLADQGVHRLEDLRGKRIGYSLAPLEPVLWGTMLSSVGVAVDDVELINVGFNTMASLLAGHVDAIGGFRNFEPIQAALYEREPVFFPQEEYGVPETYEILLVVHPERAAVQADVLRLFLDALAEAIAVTQDDPERAFALFLQAHPDLDDELNRRSFEATLPRYAVGARHDDADIWTTMQSYLVEHGLIDAGLPLEGLWRADLLP